MVINTFDWYGEDVAVPQQQAIAVYENPCGEIVIHQRDQYDEEPELIYIAKDNVLKFIGELLRAAGMDTIELIYSTSDEPYKTYTNVPLQAYRPALSDPEPDVLAEPEPDGAKAKPKDRTAAERQRRYRERNRNRNGVTPIMDELEGDPNE